MSIGGNDLLREIEGIWPKLGVYLRSYIKPAIETTAQNAAVDTSSEIPPPNPPESISVTTSGEFMQVVVNHTAPIQKGAQYITHVSTNPQFTNPMIHDHGCSRCPPPFPLPTKDTTGANHSYYVGTIVQYPGGPPSAPTYFGGASPAPIAMGGTTQMNIQPGTGSGTASTGAQAFVGIGKSQVRIASTSKRSVG